MIKNLLFVVAVIWFTGLVNAQTLFVPSGTSGIGTSGNGNVGIGIDNPSAKLEIYQSNSLGITKGNNLKLFNIGGSVGDNNFYNTKWIVRNTNGRDWYTTRLHDGISIDVSFWIPQADTRTWWERDPIYNIQSWGNADQTYLTINNGNIGIGTTNPISNSKIDIRGGGLNIGGNGTEELDATLHIRTSYGGFDRLTQMSPSEPNKPALNLIASTDASGNYLWWSWGVLNSGIWAIQPSWAFGGTLGLFMNRDGNVLIGKTTQTNTTYKLDVTGKVRADEITVNTTGADFVFAPTYKLRPLAEVEQFIKTNGHLPEIPKAEDVQQNGVNLGEMQTKLLQKVEELTLYSIELKKENIAQSQENAELKQKLADYEKEMKELKNLLMEKLK